MGEKVKYFLVSARYWGFLLLSAKPNLNVICSVLEDVQSEALA